MPNQTDRQVLTFFNRKADKLERSRIMQQLRSDVGGWSLGASSPGGAWEVERHGPDRDAMETFALTVRFFVQDNEPTSFRQMAQRYGTLQVAPDLVDEFNKVRSELNAFLDAPTWIIMDGVELTRRRIFETFLYGEMSHANEDKLVEHDKWEQIPELYPLLENEFIVAAMGFLAAIFHVRDINRRALGQLPT